MKTYEFSNGDAIPALGLGTWKSKRGEVYDAIVYAIKSGYRHIDCAHIYQNEPEIGIAIKDVIKSGDVKREELWITSKLWNNAHFKTDVRPAIERTLTDLQLDYLDLYLMHWPVALKPGTIYPSTKEEFVPLTEAPLHETWLAMEACRKAGLTRHIGVSNFSILKIRDLIRQTSVKPEMNQIEMHPFLQQNEMLEFCKNQNIILTAYSPLGSVDRPLVIKAPDEPSLMENETILKVANAHECTAAQVLISWAIQRNTSVIPKSVNPERISQNFKAADITLSAEEMRQIAALDMQRRFLTGGLWTIPGSGYTQDTLWDA